MTIIDLRTMRESSPPPFSVVCLGNFDGIHVGHETLVKVTKEKANELAPQFPGIASGACFFKKAPSDYFPTAKVPHLMTLEQKLSHFFKLGLDYAFITDFEEIVKLDTHYICNWSLGLDFKILFKTVWSVLHKDGAM